MSKIKFSKGKFSKFISSKGFYAALAVCLVGAGAATWLAVDRTITGIEQQNSQIIGSENRFVEFPSLGEVEKKQPEVPKPPIVSSSEPSSSSPTSSSSSVAALEPPVQSEIPTVSPKSPTLSYALPIKGEILTPFSNGELIKNITLGDWRTHDGIDIYAEKGTDVLAAADGVVSEIRSDPLWGVVIAVSHANGTQSVYCGLDKVVPVKVGENVMVKQVIGRLDGVPCEITERSHLHFAIKKDNAWVDPMSLIGKQQ